MNAIVQTLNTAGRGFVDFAVPMLLQSSVLILILLAVDAVLRKRVRAVFRYWIWMLVLVKLVLPPSLWSPVSVGTWFGDKLEVSTAALHEAPEPPVESRPAEPSPLVTDLLSQQRRVIAEPPGPNPVAVPPTPAPTESAPFGVPRLRGSDWSFPPEGGTPNLLSWQGLVLLVWAATIAALLLLLVQRTFFVRGLMAQAQEASLALLRELDQCRQRMGLSKPVSLRLSPHAASPAVCGLWRPAILVPQNLASRLHGADLQAVLFHELAHVKRGDLWVNLLQTLLQILYFYNPLLWLANAAIRRIREKAVDETVLVALGEAASQYPETLIHVAQLALARRPTLSLRLIGVVESKSALTGRIRHILNRPLPKTAKLGLLGFLVVLAVAAVLLPMAKAKPVAGSAPEASVPLEEEQGIDEKGATGSALAEPGEDADILEFRIAPKLDEVGPQTVEKYKQALTEGRRPPNGDFAWFEVRLSTSLTGDQITCEYGGKTYLLLWNDKSHVLLKDQDWRLEDVHSYDGASGPVIALKMDDAGAQLFSKFKRANLMRHMAVVFARRVIADYLIHTSLTLNPTLMGGQFTVEEVDQIVAALGKGMPKRDVPAATAPATSPAKTPSQEPSGRVVDPNGRPAAGAQVVRNTGIVIHNGVLEQDEDQSVSERIVETDAEGRFRLDRSLAQRYSIDAEGRLHPDDSSSYPFHLLVAHRTGFAYVASNEFQKSSEIRLQRWGRIEGQLAKSRGGLDHRVWMRRLPKPLDFGERRVFRYDAPYGADGRFVFEKVPPGWYEVGYLVTVGDKHSGFTLRTPVAVKAGETVTVKVGGEGRPVIGRFVAPASYGRPVYFGNGFRALHGKERIEGPLLSMQQWEQQHPQGDPRGFWEPRVWDYAIGTADGQRQVWYWLNRDRLPPNDDEPSFSDANWSDVNWRSYAFRINSDGSFRIEDVKPGTYELAVDLERSSDEQFSSSDAPFARYHGTIEIPSMAQTYTDQPLDLGALMLDVFGVGDPAPLFEGRTVSGQRIRLLDYRGRFVLLNFWGGANRDRSRQPDGVYGNEPELDYLQELHKAYRDKGVLQIIGINLLDTEETVRTYVAEHKIEWPQIQSSADWDKGIFAPYRVPYLSHNVLVDPEGRIVATHLRGDRLIYTVREALRDVRAPIPVPPTSPNPRMSAPPAVAPPAPPAVQEISGRVVDSNGRPVAGAQVALSTEKIGVTVDSGMLEPPRTSDMGKGPIVETDAEGRFHFEGQPPESFDVIAAHKTGFTLVASEAFNQTHEIRLERWGRIEGQLAQGREALESQVWMAGLPNETWFKHKREFRSQAYCDTAGRFTFNYVPPGWFEVGYLTKIGDLASTFTSRTPVVVKAGETAQMKLGGEGRPVIGRFVPRPGYSGPVYFGAGLRSLETARPEPPRPANYNEMTKREQQEWYRQWRQTPEYQAYSDKMWHDPDWRSYTFRLQEDGTFRIADVIAGKYDLTVWLEERFTGQGRPEEIGAYYGTVEVPTIPGGRTEEPLDLGNLTVAMHNPPLHVGDTAPLFEVKTLDGKDLRLIDYRGKFVLLSFWQPQSHPELERLKDLDKTYGSTGRLQIIGLGGWDTQEEVRRLVAEHQIAWPEIYFGTKANEGIAGQYGLPGVPYILLVNPEGRIVATWLRGEKLTETVRQALPQTAGSPAGNSSSSR